MLNNIKSPAHYTEGRKYEPKDVIRDWGLNFNLGSAVKYLSRAGRKDAIIQDLKKAQEFIQFEREAIEAERTVYKEDTEDIKDYEYNGCGSCERVAKCYDAYSYKAIHCGNYGKGDK